MAVHPTTSRSRRALIAVATATATVTATLAGGLLAPAGALAADGALRSDPGPTPLLHACPIDGDSTYEDSWGWARSGGRRHQGVDMIAEHGTPVLAVRDGDATFKNTRLGGRSIWIETDGGDRFFYAHLDAWEGESRRVEAGELIGYVGKTGNARGTHLHFETRPSGDPENPYPHVIEACTGPTSVEPDASDPLAWDSWQHRIEPEPTVDRIGLANTWPRPT